VVLKGADSTVRGIAAVVLARSRFPGYFRNVRERSRLRCRVFGELGVFVYLDGAFSILHGLREGSAAVVVVED
jgi:hypothetical protein